LTEKPSVAKDFAKALGIGGRGDGFLEGSGFIITWAVGHLMELAEPEDYDAKWKRWSLDSLPILPDRLKYNPIQNVRKQLEVVRRQVSREDVEKIVIATDAGREGEVIARTILAETKAPEERMYRFWTSQALTPQVVLGALDAVKPASEYDRLWRAGHARQVADWLVGMNLSRAATLRMGRARGVFSVGRVQTAVLALLVDRRREREDFKPEPYWMLRARFSNDKGTWWGIWFKKAINRFTVKEEADRVAALVEGAEGKVASVKRSKQKQPPPPLYSLTDLQREANVKYSLSATETLDTAQRLYEALKCLSYPRTDSKVLGSENVDLAKRLVAKLSGVYAETFAGVLPARISASNKRVFNDAKLTDHHALIPLAPLPQSAGEREKKIYDLVLKRFAAVFHPDYEYEATEIVTDAEKETFRTRGSRPLAPGWKAVYGMKEASASGSPNEDEPEEENLPLVEKGDPAKVEETKTVEKMTEPPPQYTEALLLKDMTNPSQRVSEEELQKIFKGNVGLGTQATRAQIIETILKRGYVLREKKHLIASDKGCFLIDSLRRFDKTRVVAAPDETARWEMELEKVAMGEGNPEAFMANIRKFVQDSVEEFKMGELDGPETQPKTLGKCPACGGEIIEGKRGFGCSNWREELGGCKFVIWKEIAGRKLTQKMLRTLLAGEATDPTAFKSKEGREFSASLKLEEDKEEGKWVTKFVFGEPGAANSGTAGKEGGGDAPDALGPCPLCDGNVVEGPKGYGCDKWRDKDGGCKFVIWKTIAGKEITREIAEEILEKGMTEVLNGFVSRKGKEFSARLRFDEDESRVVFVF
jgi:DNA topoisomerase-3